jgi:TolA-binding protein
VSVRDLLAVLPPVARWSILGTLGLLVVLAAAAGVRGFLQYREGIARQAFIEVKATYREATEPSAGESQLAEAAKRLKQFLDDYPRSRLAAEAWYSLGNVEYRRRDYDAARAAFAEAAQRGAGTLRGLSLLGIGYAWEGKGDLARALEAYREAVQGYPTKDPVFGELLLATARVQEELKQPAAAIETYRRLLKEAPDSARVEDARSRLAILGANPA